MLSGKELGLAIAQAIEKKISSGAVKTKAEIARHFNVKPPSIHDWIKKGSISKDKLPELWRYFSDVVGPEHWGLDESKILNKIMDASGKSFYDETKILYNAYFLATEERREVVNFLLSIQGSSTDWVDADARAYINALDTKASNWLETIRESRHKKTGS